METWPPEGQADLLPTATLGLGSKVPHLPQCQGSSGRGALGISPAADAAGGAGAGGHAWCRAGTAAGAHPRHEGAAAGTAAVRAGPCPLTCPLYTSCHPLQWVCSHTYTIAPKALCPEEGTKAQGNPTCHLGEVRCPSWVPNFGSNLRSLTSDCVPRHFTLHEQCRDNSRDTLSYVGLWDLWDKSGHSQQLQRGCCMEPLKHRSAHTHTDRTCNPPAVAQYLTKGDLSPPCREKDALWQKTEGIDPPAPSPAPRDVGLCTRCGKDFRLLSRRYSCRWAREDIGEHSRDTNHHHTPTICSLSRLCQGKVCHACSVDMGKQRRCCLLCYQQRHPQAM